MGVRTVHGISICCGLSQKFINTTHIPRSKIFNIYLCICEENSWSVKLLTCQRSGHNFIHTTKCKECDPSYQILSIQHCPPNLLVAISKTGNMPNVLAPTPQGTEGPFYLPKQALRSDITEGCEGLPFLMKFNIKDFNKGGTPVPNAEVHCWHADANGVYSGYLSLYPLEQNSNGISGMMHVEPTDDATFLRGIQPTDSDGSAVFKTVFPGWYGRRTPHIHFKVLVGGKDCYTGEVYFEDLLTDEIIAKGVKPYCERDASTKQINRDDPVFEEFQGEKTVVIAEGDVATSLQASLDVIVCV